MISFRFEIGDVGERGETNRVAEAGRFLRQRAQAGRLRERATTFFIRFNR